MLQLVVLPLLQPRANWVGTRKCWLVMGEWKKDSTCVFQNICNREKRRTEQKRKHECFQSFNITTVELLKCSLGVLESFFFAGQKWTIKLVLFCIACSTREEMCMHVKSNFASSVRVKPAQTFLCMRGVIYLWPNLRAGKYPPCCVIRILLDNFKRNGRIMFVSTFKFIKCFV